MGNLGEYESKTNTVLNI